MARKLGNGWIDSSFDMQPPAKRARRAAPTRRKPDKVLSGRDVSWSLKYQPSSKEELAVHKKKVQEIELWITSSLRSQSRPCPILLLTGPPGCGKTAALRTLCDSLGLQLKEWANNPQLDLPESADLELRRHSLTCGSQASLFSSYLLRASRYPSLLEDGLPSRILLLVEEFPNHFFMDPSLFHNILRQYSAKGKCLLIFIVSDTSGRMPADQLLFPAHLRSELNIAHIAMNPVAPTALLKVLKSVATQAAKLKHCRIPSTQQLEEIATAAGGDIRCALNVLQFSMGASGGELVCGESGLHTKDTPLFLFHALGKVLYAKRTEEPKPKQPLPPLLSNPEEIFEKTVISSESFGLFLHQNYLDFAGDVETAARCLDWMVEFDGLTVGLDRLDQLAASVCARGLMFNLRSPAKGWKPLHKPHWHSVIQQVRSNTAAVRGQFPVPLSTEQLTQYLPYNHLISPGQLGPCSKLFTFPRNTYRHGERLSEKAGALVEDDDDNQPPEVAAVVPPAQPMDISDNDDDNVEIEEYDD